MMKDGGPSDRDARTRLEMAPAVPKVPSSGASGLPCSHASSPLAIDH